MENESNLTEQNLLSLTRIISQAPSLKRLNREDQEEELLRAIESRFKRGGEWSRGFVESLLKSSGMDDALAVIRQKFVEAEGCVPQRILHTIHQGTNAKRKVAEMTELNQEPTAEKKKRVRVPTEPKAPKEPKAPRAKKVIGEKADPKILKNKLISAAGPNWRREGSHGYKTAEVIIANPGSTIEKIIELGGRKKDILWDLQYHIGKITLTEIPTEA